MKKNIINLKGAHKLAIGEYDDDLYLNEVTHVFVRPKTASDKRVYIEALKALLTDALYWMYEEEEEVQSIYLDDEWIGEVVYALDFNMLDEANGVPTYNPNIPTLVVTFGAKNFGGQMYFQKSRDLKGTIGMSMKKGEISFY